MNKKSFQYYYRQSTADPNGSYIPKENRKLANRLAQQEYDRLVLEAVSAELSALEKIRKVNNDHAEEIIEKLPLGKRILVNPVWENDEQFAEKWKRETYNKLDFGKDNPIFYSAKGEMVRSKSEVLLADLLDRLEVPYKYEKPLMFNDGKVVFPDFTLLDIKRRKEVYLEHLGLIDYEEYREANLVKIRRYERNGFFLGDRLLITVESSAHPLDIHDAEMKIRHLLQI